MHVVRSCICYHFHLLSPNLFRLGFLQTAFLHCLLFDLCFFSILILPFHFIFFLCFQFLHWNILLLLSSAHASISLYFSPFPYSCITIIITFFSSFSNLTAIFLSAIILLYLYFLLLSILDFQFSIIFNCHYNFSFCPPFFVFFFDGIILHSTSFYFSFIVSLFSFRV